MYMIHILSQQSKGSCFLFSVKSEVKSQKMRKRFLVSKDVVLYPVALWTVHEIKGFGQQVKEIVIV